MNTRVFFSLGPHIAGYGELLLGWYWIEDAEGSVPIGPFKDALAAGAAAREAIIERAENALQSAPRAVK